MDILVFSLINFEVYSISIFCVLNLFLDHIVCISYFNL
jgi:hypothetical protein